jgi:quercetin dioxygenase-like cupin family protein
MRRSIGPVCRPRRTRAPRRYAPRVTEIRKLGEGRALRLADGVEAYPLFGEGAMLNMVRLAPHAEVALHRHPHEQLGIVLAGSIAMTFDGEEHVLGVHEAYAIPGDVEHRGLAGPDGCTVLDVFRPVREDYRALEQES